MRSPCPSSLLKRVISGLRRFAPGHHALASCIRAGQVQPYSTPTPQWVQGGHAASGDHAGSDASVGVVTTLSLKPVISTETRRDEKPEPRLSRAAD